MSQCDAVVVETAGTDAWVEVSGRAPTCGNCKGTDACQGSLLGLNAGPRRYLLENRIGARVGDRVQLSVADGTVWRATLASYVLPLLLAIAGAVIGQSLSGDAWAATGTLAGLGCGLVLLRGAERRARVDGNRFSLQIKTTELRIKEES